MSKVSLSVNGSIFGGWKEVSIVKSLTTLCGSFTLEVTDAWNYTDPSWRIMPGDRVELFIDDVKVKTGFVDRIDPSFSGSDKGISISGRDITADLVDCSADLKVVEFRNLKPLKIIEKLVKPFGIQIVDQTTGVAALDLWTIQRAETVLENLEKICKKRGLLAVTDSDGRLVLLSENRGRAHTALIEGLNILSGSASFDQSNRFSNYKVQAQQQGSDSFMEDDLDTENFLSGVQATATDQVVKRFRPLVVVMNTAGSEADAKRRVQWEASLRAAQSSKAQVTVQGWKQGDGNLWDVNLLVPVKSPILGIDQDMLISSVTFSLTTNGEITKLELDPPDAYKPEPVINEPSGRWKELG